jgi:hypothetical protein
VAELQLGGAELVLHLSVAEKAEPVHGDTPRGVRVRLEGAPWDEWIVNCADPEAVAAALASQR